MPASKPMAMRPLGPIQLFSNAYFRKKETPIRMATMPIRLDHCCPMRVSRLACSFWGAANIVPCQAGAVGGDAVTGTGVDGEATLGAGTFGASGGEVLWARPAFSS